MVMKEFTAGERLFAADLNDNFDETQLAGNITAGTINAARLPPLLFVENGKTANYTLILSDAAKVIAMNSTSNRIVTIPANATVAFPVGSVVNVYRQGTGAVTVAAAAGVTLRKGGKIRNQFGEVSCRKRATNEWVVAGDTV